MMQEPLASCNPPNTYRLTEASFKGRYAPSEPCSCFIPLISSSSCAVLQHSRYNSTLCKPVSCIAYWIQIDRVVAGQSSTELGTSVQSSQRHAHQMPTSICRCSWPQILNIDNIMISLSEESCLCNTEVDEKYIINARIENSYLVKTKVCAKEKLKIQSQAHSDTSSYPEPEALGSCQ